MRRLLNKTQAEEKTGYCAAHLMRLSKARRFPMFIKIGEGKQAAVRWDELSVDQWIEERARAAQAAVESATQEPV